MSVRGKTTAKRVGQIRLDFRECFRALDALPRKTRNELYDLLFDWHDGYAPTARAFDTAFQEWLDGGRI